MNLEELLKSIREALANLTGDDDATKAQRKELETSADNIQALIDQAKQATAAAGGQAQDGESELERLRRESRERSEGELVKTIVDTALEQVRNDETAQQQRIAGAAVEAVKQHLAGGSGTTDLNEAVKQALATQREGSRYAGVGSDPDHAAQVAAAAAAGGAQKRPDVQVSAPGFLKRIDDQKSIAGFMGVAARIKSGVATEAERNWMAAKQNPEGQKAMAEMTDSAGGYLVPQEWMPDILGLLRAQAIVRQAGPRFQPFNKQMNQTSVSSGATAYYTAENARITPSEPTLAEAPLLTPKNLTGLVPVSNFLLNDSPEADALVRGDLAEVLSLREDLSFLQGTGAGGEPVGMRNFVGRTQNPLGSLGVNGAQITLAQFRRIRARTRTLNAQNPTWVLFFAPELITYLETLTDSEGRFLADTSILQINPDGMSGRFDGVPFFTSTQVPANLTVGTSTNGSYIILANVRELVVGINQELVLDVSSEATYTTDGGTTWRSAFQENQTLFRAVMRHDIAARRPSQIIVQEGVLV